MDKKTLEECLKHKIVKRIEIDDGTINIILEDRFYLGETKLELYTLMESINIKVHDTNKEIIYRGRT
jgi:hypothetical protein